MSLAITILGRRYRLRFPRLRGCRGFCDPPDQPNKAIGIDARLRGREALEVAIHEALHAAAWEQFSEEWVDRTAKDIAAMLWRHDLRERIWPSEADAKEK